MNDYFIIKDSFLQLGVNVIEFKNCSYGTLNISHHDICDVTKIIIENKNILFNFKSNYSFYDFYKFNNKHEYKIKFIISSEKEKFKLNFNGFKKIPDQIIHQIQLKENNVKSSMYLTIRGMNRLVIFVNEPNKIFYKFKINSIKVNRNFNEYL